MCVISQKERRTFITWLVRTFKRNTAKADYGISPDKLLELYKVMRKTELTEEDIVELVYMIGWTEDKDQDLYIEPIISVIEDFEKETLLAFSLINWDPITKHTIWNLYKRAERREELGSSGLYQAEKQILSADDSLDIFYNTWCVDLREVDFVTEIDTSYRKAIVSRIKEAYAAFCRVNVVRELPWSIVRRYLTVLKKHNVGVGYACGKSGQSYLYWLYVPGNADKDELKRAIKHNFLTIKTKKGNYIDNKGRSIDINAPAKTYQLWAPKAPAALGIETISEAFPKYEVEVNEDVEEPEKMESKGHIETDDDIMADSQVEEDTSDVQEQINIEDTHSGSMVATNSDERGSNSDNTDGDSPDDSTTVVKQRKSKKLSLEQFADIFDQPNGGE